MRKNISSKIIAEFCTSKLRKNIKFLKWLGVEIPAETEKLLIEDLSKMTDKSMEIAVNVLQKH